MIYIYKNLFVTYDSTLEQRKLTVEVIYFKLTNKYQKVLQDISKPQVRFDTVCIWELRKINAVRNLLFIRIQKKASVFLGIQVIKSDF